GPPRARSTDGTAGRGGISSGAVIGGREPADPGGRGLGGETGHRILLGATRASPRTMDSAPAPEPGSGRAPTDPAAPTILDGWPGGPLGFRQRSIRYHRPRAPFCGRGDCTSCLVRVNGVPNIRACQYRPAPNDRIETENAWPSPRFDLGRILDLLFPHGIDTTRGLLRPSMARPLYQRIVRRLAGYGRFPTPLSPDAAAGGPTARGGGRDRRGRRRRSGRGGPARARAGRDDGDPGPDRLGGGDRPARPG
ncbi:FAD-dependent pyridine nucleotide-disulfide oxidoreductase, partial [mine drainage metagenome]